MISALEGLTHWGIVTSYASGNGLLANGTEPLPEPMSTYHRWSSVTHT